MSVAFGSEITSNNVNTAFMSRNSDTSTIGKVDLENADAISGPSIINLQAKVNGLTFINHSVESIANGAELSMTATQKTIGLQQRKVQSTSGLLSLSATPFGNVGGWIDGTTIKIMGVSDANAQTLIHNDNDYGCIVNGNFTLGRFSTIVLFWDESLLRWIAQCRNS